MVPEKHCPRALVALPKVNFRVPHHVKKHAVLTLFSFRSNNREIWRRSNASWPPTSPTFGKTGLIIVFGKDEIPLQRGNLVQRIQQQAHRLQCSVLDTVLFFFSSHQRAEQRVLHDEKKNEGALHQMEEEEAIEDRVLRYSYSWRPSWVGKGFCAGCNILWHTDALQSVDHEGVTQLGCVLCARQTPFRLCQNPRIETLLSREEQCLCEMEGMVFLRVPHLQRPPCVVVERRGNRVHVVLPRALNAAQLFFCVVWQCGKMVWSEQTRCG